MASKSRSLKLNPETWAALNRLHEKTDIPVATLIRKAIAEYLNANGEKIDTSLDWGGNREKKED